MNRSEILRYYTRDDIAHAIVENAKHREIAAAYWDGKYDKRPNMIQYPQDIEQLVRKGITSFHYSVERWSNPMAITTDRYNQLRIGWDMILDIDSKLGIPAAQKTAELILEFLKTYGITHAGVKFSGSRGFHIALPWEMFPQELDYKPLAQMYPEAPRAIAEYLRSHIAPKLRTALLEFDAAKQMKEQNQLQEDFDPFTLVEVEKSWGNRHMFRAPYSFNEKTWHVSLPLTAETLPHFKPEDADPDKVTVKNQFFQGVENEATNLLLEAMDAAAAQRTKEEEKIKPQKEKVNRGAIPETFFPPCIKIILNGLEDGKKRSTYTLINFLRAMNWDWQTVETTLFAWNQKNTPPLPRAVLLGQLQWAQRNERLPANCFHDQYYMSFGICQPDETCKKMNAKAPSNPISYPLFRMPRQQEAHRGFACGDCKEEFKTQKALESHKNRKHSVEFV
ncbi:MAG: hypothetical protein HY832_02980 [Candidatus Aenigmarchaeota archaeon]|nr:hypothetical protein [Candidatus Aenigmarchaeota archaeon]